MLVLPGPGSLAEAAAAAGIVSSRGAPPSPQPYRDFAGALRAPATASDGGAAPPPGLKRAASAGYALPRPPATGVGAPRPAADGHGLAAALGGALGDGNPKTLTGRGEVGWVATGDAAAAEYSDARAVARDHMRLRNQCFMQARCTPCTIAG